MRACLTNTMGLIANASVDSIQLIGYNETITYIEDATVYDYCIRSTICICESDEGQAHRALEASIQRERYDEVLSQCLGRAVTGVSGSFTSTRSALPALGASPMSSTVAEFPTQQPTRPRRTKNSKKYYDTAKSFVMNAGALSMVLDAMRSSLYIYLSIENAMQPTYWECNATYCIKNENGTPIISKDIPTQWQLHRTDWPPQHRTHAETQSIYLSILSYPILSFLILSCDIISYDILSYAILSYAILCTIAIHRVTPLFFSHFSFLSMHSLLDCLFSSLQAFLLVIFSFLQLFIQA